MKTLLTVTLLFFSISTISAQDSNSTDNKKFDFGIRHGYRVWDISNSTRAISASNTNLYLGLFVETRLSEKLSLQLETNYSYSEILELPLLLKYKISDKFELYGGAQLNLSIESNRTPQRFRNEKYGASLILGTQYNINKHWFLEARYNYGLSNQFRIYEYQGAGVVFGRKQSFNFGLGYKF